MKALVTLALAVLVVGILYSHSSVDRSFFKPPVNASKASRAVSARVSLRAKASTVDDSVKTEEFQYRAAQYLALERRIDRAQSEIEFWNQILQAEDAAQTSVKVLVDWRDTLARFGQNQAQARVFAIRLLEETARRGEPHPLQAALVALRQQYSIRPDGFSQHGRIQDLQDLMTSWILAYGREKFIKDPSDFFTQIYDGQAVPESENLLVLKAVRSAIGSRAVEPGFMNKFYSLANGQRGVT